MPDPYKVAEEPAEEAETYESRSSKLSSEQKKLASIWYEDKAKKHDPKCSVCGSGDWAILDDFVEPICVAPGSSPSFGVASYPHFMLACTNCGHVHFINAYRAGVAFLKKDK